MPFDSKFDCAAAVGRRRRRMFVAIARMTRDAGRVCRARNDAGNQIWAGSNLTARKQRGEDRAEALTESMITAKTSSSSSSSIRCVSVPLPPFPLFHIHPHPSLSRYPAYQSRQSRCGFRSSSPPLRMRPQMSLTK